MSDRSRLLRQSITLILTASVGTVQAAGFAIIEQSAQGLGNAYSGATVGGDLSVAYFNPAALTRYEEEAVMLAGHIISPSFTFTDKGSSLGPAGSPVIAGSNGGDAGSEAAVPNFYYTKPVNEDMHFGLSVNVPYGLSTTYSSDWVGRFHAINSSVQTLNVNPSLSWKVNDKLSFGLGVNIQYITAELSAHIDSFGTCVKFNAGTGADAAGLQSAQQTCAAAGLLPASVAGSEVQDSYSTIEGEDTSVGFNFGLLYEASDATDIGFAVRSKIDHTLDGSADFTINPVLLDSSGAGAVSANANLTGLPLARILPRALADQSAVASIDLPAMASISVGQQLTPELKLFADYTWTGWSSVEELRVQFEGSLAGAANDNVSTLAWKDTSRISVGADYALSDTLTLRAGLASDESPVPDAAHRTARIPDSDRTWVAFGASIETSDQASFDIGYAMVDFDDAEINNVKEDGSGYTLNGSVQGSVDIISAQYNFTF